jgi:hypothetical protein
MKVIARFVLAATLLSTVTACTSTSVIPHAGGMFTVISTSSTEAKADKLSLRKAEGICEQQNVKPKVIDLETVYLGIDAAQQKLAKLANKLLPPSKASGPYTPIDHEYKSTLTFKCE